MDGESYGKAESRYDVRGNLLEYYRDGILLEQNRYDARGNRIQRRDGDGIGVSCRYGLQDERLETFTSNSQKEGKAVQKLTYDARSRITGVEWRMAAAERQATALTAGEGSQQSAMQRADRRSMPMTRRAISRRLWMPEAEESAMPTTVRERSAPLRTRAGIQRPSGMIRKAGRYSIQTVRA